MSVDARIGDDCDIDPSVTLVPADGEREPPRIGDGSIIRSHSIICADVVLGERVATGHRAVVRGGTTVGDDSLIGTATVVDGDCTIGDDVSMQTGVYVPPATTIGSHVFLGPHAVLTNDPYPLRQDVDLDGPTLADHVSVGANATILPGVTVGERSFVAAGAVVTEDVPPETMAAGAPAEHRPLPAELEGGNAQ